jgi:hypothetical protein
MTPDATPVTRAYLDRAVESIANDFSELRQELRRLIEPIATRLDTIERRVEATETSLNSVLVHLAGIS